MVNAQEWLDRNYPKENRNEVREVYILEFNLEGELDLSDFKNLEWLDCGLTNRKLTNLDVSNCPNLTYLNCKYCSLVSISLSTNLKKVDLSNNNFSCDLSFLSKVVDLEELILANNKFTGSLKPLENLTKLKDLNISNNQLTGSLDYLSKMEKLKTLDISDTDLNEVNISKLPRCLKKIEYLIKRPNCKLTEIILRLKRYENGWCEKCYQLNTSQNWCQPCREKEWQESIKNLTGQELIEKFVQQQGEDHRGRDRLLWIPYEQFTNIEYLATGGFSKIYKAKWQSEEVALKVLNNSRNITLEFLTEITNIKLVDNSNNITKSSSFIVKCHGISQDPETENYLIVMDYKESGNLRQFLQQKKLGLNLKDKLLKLGVIVSGLSNIHQQGLVHRDFHSGNILNSGSWSYITDLGLSRPVNYQKEEGKIFGVLPYMAPEVLRGKSYTQASDIYAFSIVAYELLANSSPYLEMSDINLSLAVCQGLRPNMDKVPLPQKVKDLIKRCWDNDPKKRPNTWELWKILSSWQYSRISEPKSGDIQDIEFEQQHKEIEEEYYNFSQTPYQNNSAATTTSKMINTNEITERLKTMEYSQDLVIDFGKLKMEESNNNDWTNIHSNFTNELIQSWTNHNFTYSQTQDWINIGLQPTDYNFATWLRDIKQLTPEEVLNHANEQELKQEDFTKSPLGVYLNSVEYQTYQQTQIEHPPK